MTWRGVPPLNELVDCSNERGVINTREKFLPILDRLDKAEDLKK